MAARSPGIYPRQTAKHGLVYDAVAQVNGKQKWSRGHRTKALAQGARDEMKVAMRNGMLGAAPARLTVEEYLTKRWLPSKEADLRSAESVRAYRYRTGRVVAVLGQRRLAQLTALDVEELKMKVRAAGAGGTTANAVYAMLNQALKQAVRWGLIMRNPCDQTDAPRKDDYEPPLLDTDTIRRVLAAADATPYGALIFTAVMTGMRWGELQALRWADIDFVASQLRIPKAKTRRGVRAIALGPSTLARLQQHRLEQMRQATDLGAEEAPVVVFTTDITGVPLNQGNFNVRWWQHIRRVAGLPTLRFHDLRHVQATLLARAGVHPRVAMERLGHANFSTSMEVYTHITVGDQAPAADAVERLLADH